MNVPLTRPSISPEDEESVLRVLRSGWLAQGEQVRLFEEEIAKYCDAGHGVATSNCTTALELIYRALGVDRRWDVCTTPLTFSATAEAARHLGATIHFVDVEHSTGNMDPQKLAQWLEGSDSGRRRLVVPVHFAGTPCRMSEIMELCTTANAIIVEDAAHALGAATVFENVGSCKFSKAAALCFHASKTLPIGEGGMVMTNDANFAQKLRLLRSHGMAKPRDESVWDLELISTGFNHRLTDVAAALGRSQLIRFRKMIAGRRAAIARYNAGLAELGLVRPVNADPLLMYIIRFNHPSLRDRVFREMRAAGIGVQIHYRPLHHQPLYQGMFSGVLPEAERWGYCGLSLPLFDTITKTEQDEVISALKHVLAT